jgi:hypothetical protein
VSDVRAVHIPLQAYFCGERIVEHRVARARLPFRTFF